MAEEKKVIMIDEISISYRSDGTVVYDTDEPTDDYEEIARKMGNVIRDAIREKRLEAHKRVDIIDKAVEAFKVGLFS